MNPSARAEAGGVLREVPALPADDEHGDRHQQRQPDVEHARPLDRERRLVEPHQELVADADRLQEPFEHRTSPDGCRIADRPVERSAVRLDHGAPFTWVSRLK